MFACLFDSGGDSVELTRTTASIYDLSLPKAQDKIEDSPRRLHHMEGYFATIQISPLPPIHTIVYVSTNASTNIINTEIFTEAGYAVWLRSDSIDFMFMNKDI